MAAPFRMLPLAAALALSAPASATDLVDAGMVEQIRQIASGHGSTEVDKLDDGSPRIKGRIDGIRYQILFYGCEKNGSKCQNIQLYAGWSLAEDQKVGMAAINDWNRNYRFGKAYLDAENDPVIEYDISLEGGVSRQNLDESLETWSEVISGFEEKVINSDDKSEGGGSGMIGAR